MADESAGYGKTKEWLYRVSLPDGKISEVNVKVINNIIGIRGKIENKKLNLFDSLNESLLQIYNFICLI